MDQGRYIIIITGEDRPGILDDVTGVVQRNSGVVEDVRSVDLHDFFSMLLSIRMNRANVESLKHQVEEVGSYGGLHVRVEPAGNPSDDTRTPYHLSITGDDLGGVLKKISHLLRVLSINIESMETRRRKGEQNHFDLVITIPPQVPLAKVREFLGQLLQPLGLLWDLDIAPNWES